MRLKRNATECLMAVLTQISFTWADLFVDTSVSLTPSDPTRRIHIQSIDCRVAGPTGDNEFTIDGNDASIDVVPFRGSGGTVNRYRQGFPIFVGAPGVPVTITLTNRGTCTAFEINMGWFEI